MLESCELTPSEEYADPQRPWLSCRRLLLGSLLLSMAGWAALGDSAQGSTPVSFVTVGQGFHSGVRDPLRAVVRTRDDWAALWTRHVGRSVAPPAVDFSAEMVIALFVGERPTSGYEVEIIAVWATEKGLRVTYQERAPSSATVVRQVLTAPFHIIRLRRTEIPVEVWQRG